MIAWDKLKEPFPAADVEWRLQSSGDRNGKVWARCLAYITARAIQDRLDDVFGVAGWRNEYREGPGGGVLCRIYFRDEQGEWVWREDGAENTEIEAVKGGISGALKRAGAALGIGRYLYKLAEGFAEVSESGANYGKTKSGATFRWNPPKLPAWALPNGASGKGVPTAIGSQSTGRTQPAAQQQQSGNGKPWDRPMPFGKTKDKPLSDFTAEELTNTLVWLNKDPERRGKHADLIRDITTTIAAAEGATDESY